MSSVGFALAVWFLPWWAMSAWAFFLGFFLPPKPSYFWKISIGAFVVWFCAAFYSNGQNHGLISRRMDTLFQLPGPYSTLLLTGTLAIVITVPFYWFGLNLRRQCSPVK